MADRLKKFEAAITIQTEIMNNNIYGSGIDIHLLGLREMAKEMEMETPKIFEHESYAISNHFRLSTSQVDLFKPFTLRTNIVLYYFLFFSLHIHSFRFPLFLIHGWDMGRSAPMDMGHHIILIRNILSSVSQLLSPAKQRPLLNLAETLRELLET